MYCLLYMDIETIKLAQNGCKNAVRLIITEYKTDIYTLCYRLAKEPEEASDICQETFIRAHKMLHKYQPTGSFRGWLSKIAYNLFITMYEKNKRRREAQPFLEQELQYIADLNEERTEDFQKSPTMEKALNNLPDKYRICLELKYFEELSIAEISTILSTEIPTVKTQLFRGKSLLRKAIKQMEKLNYEM